VQVYIEYVIIDNFVITALIGLLTLRTLRIRAPWYRIATTATTGTAFAIFMPFINLHPALLFFLKILSAVPLVLLLHPPKKFRRFLLTYLTFFGYTFLTGGAAFGLIYLMSGDITQALSLNYQSPVSIGLILAFAAALAYCVSRAAIYINKKRVIIPYTCNFEITLADKTTGRLNGFIDSGNSLYDPKTQLPVVVARAEIINRLLGAEVLEKYILTGSLKNIPDARLIDFSTLT
jgi:stage II sporulation protein GA (sporulation sigma-E factor processing peptidase)